MWSHKDHDRGTVPVQMLMVVDWCSVEINRTKTSEERRETLNNGPRCMCT